ncbi:MAG TPA: hydrogenase expression/formation protein HypE [Labilithrix sp.]|nr:hydrogenase expression/formation protein HypE [Labilithrix sp.]
MSFECPVPLPSGETILMGHGGGGRMSAELLTSVFLPAFENDTLLALEDQARLAVGGGTIALTTDAFVVRPLFFPGGDIGRLSVSGTINDLVVGGARPIALTAAFVLEEGLAIADLRRVVASMRAACDEARVRLVAGDTKVVDRGKGDGIYLTTTGVGVVPPGREALSVSAARPGDAIVVSGTLGDHGVAILSVREGLDFETTIVSDVAPLGSLVEHLLASGVTVRAMRDPTRGGLATTLHEIADRSQVGIVIDEDAIPVAPEVRAACEILGLEPLNVANEGKVVVVVDSSDADRAVSTLREHPRGQRAAVVGRVTAEHPRVVRMRTTVGGERVVAMPAGQQLPRIC